MIEVIIDIEQTNRDEYTKDPIPVFTNYVLLQDPSLDLTAKKYSQRFYRGKGTTMTTPC